MLNDVKMREKNVKTLDFLQLIIVFLQHETRGYCNPYNNQKFYLTVAV